MIGESPIQRLTSRIDEMTARKDWRFYELRIQAVKGAGVNLRWRT